MLEANLAIEAVLAPVLTVITGSWIDSKFGISPWGLITGAVIGISLSVVLLIMLIKRVNKDDGDN
jgi:F0F1-type ATP synthase assembly protein I